MYILQDTILKRIDISKDQYNYKILDILGIQIIAYTTGVDKPKKIKISEKSFGESRDLVNMSELKSNINKIYPINEKGEFGVLLNKKILNGVIEYITLLDGSKVDFQECVNKYSNSNKFTSNIDFYQKKVGDKDYIFVIKLNNKTPVEKKIDIFNIQGMKIQSIVESDIDLISFKRQIGNVSFYINRKGIFNKEIVIKFPSIYTNKLSSWLSKLIHPNYKYGTLDLETFKLDGKSYVYCLGFYTEGDLKMFYIDEDLQYDGLILRCLDAMLADKYNGYTFYVHNLARFDIYFILPALNRFDKIYPNKYQFKDNIVFRDDEIISMKISTIKKTENSRKTITIKLVDSCKLLDSDLNKLCKTFNTETKKSYFPYDFISKNTLFYVNKKPSIEKYGIIDRDSYDEFIHFYNEIPEDHWSTKNETLLYLEKDLVSLYQVMRKFITSIYIDYHIHVTSSLTISSLSMDVFLRRFYKNNIPLIKEKSIFNDIKESYFGGITEVYKPYGKNLYYYDVNSLYPYSALNPMPGLNCVYNENFNKDISEINNLFGFYFCEVETNKGYLGLLSVRINNGIIQPLGEFKGWYFSEELKFAHSNGYKIKIIKGYTFNKVEDVFKDYFEHLYNIKSHSSDEVERALAKSKLNNLIGKLGTSIDKYHTKIVSSEEFLDILNTRKYRGAKYLDDDTIITSYDKEISRSICEQNDIDYIDTLMNIASNTKKGINKEEKYNNVSIALASAITAYSRIYLNKIKLDILSKGGSIFYSDTDSIVTDIPLSEDQVGSEIGKFKLEHKIVEGYFISNKTYSFKNQNNKIISVNKGAFKNKAGEPINFDGHKSLVYKDFKDLYLGKDVKTFRFESNKNLNIGYVNIKIPNKITLSPNSYTKRLKIFNQNKMWIDTKPLVLNKKTNQSPHKYKNRLLANIIKLFTFLNSLLYTFGCIVIYMIVILIPLGFDINYEDIDLIDSKGYSPIPYIDNQSSININWEVVWSYNTILEWDEYIDFDLYEDECIDYSLYLDELNNMIIKNNSINYQLTNWFHLSINWFHLFKEVYIENPCDWIKDYINKFIDLFHSPNNQFKVSWNDTTHNIISNNKYLDYKVVDSKLLQSFKDTPLDINVLHNIYLHNINLSNQEIEELKRELSFYKVRDIKNRVLIYDLRNLCQEALVSDRVNSR
jgi:hypothetical protein